jgi:hypothetical protein
MYTTCLYCNGYLGTNEVIEPFPVGRRLAFDAERGRLWVVCGECGRWNLSPVEERWEAIEACERLFRETHLRVSTDNIGLAQLREGLDLVRIGKALRPEIAAWRYGRYLQQWVPQANTVVARAAKLARTGVEHATRAIDWAADAMRVSPSYDALTWLRIHRRGRQVLDLIRGAEGEPSLIVRYRHLEETALVRPGRHDPWQLLVRHDRGYATLTGDDGLRSAGKLLAALNGFGCTDDIVRTAIGKVDDAGNPDGYFQRVAAIALRTSWGQVPDAVDDGLPLVVAKSSAERLALHITNRSFWGRGAVGSEPRTELPRLPLVDRLALEMAANEDAERKAMQGELTDLEQAWREAEEIAEIADSLFSRRARTYGLVPGRLLPA